ncbi:MAG TPA: hypothetical protein VKY19_26860 [Ktedonosporobacter sp.]|nr:hypothetical protein [Ktedonosporobacter sp.]
MTLPRGKPPQPQQGNREGCPYSTGKCPNHRGDEIDRVSHDESGSYSALSPQQPISPNILEISPMW